MNKISLNELQTLNNWEEAVVVFTKESFNKPYIEEERSYKISTDAKFFNSDMIGNSLFGNCLDGSDNGVRLDLYMNNGKNSWKVDYCYIIK